MPHPNSNGLIGLIVIETSTDGPAVDLAGHDATVGQFLAWLAGGPCAVRDESGEAARSRRRGRFPSGTGPARVAADCRGLDAQLERAVAQLRREIAAA